jgi:hypothetical protein
MASKYKETDEMRWKRTSRNEEPLGWSTAACWQGLGCEVIITASCHLAGLRCEVIVVPVQIVLKPFLASGKQRTANRQWMAGQRETRNAVHAAQPLVSIA